MLADNFINPLFWPIFKNNQIYIGVMDKEKNNWVKMLRLKICNEDGSYSIFCFFLIYNRFGSIRLWDLGGIL